MCIISNAIAIEFFQTPPDFDKKNPRIHNNPTTTTKQIDFLANDNCIRFNNNRDWLFRSHKLFVFDSVLFHVIQK